MACRSVCRRRKLFGEKARSLRAGEKFARKVASRTKQSFETTGRVTPDGSFSASGLSTSPANCSLQTFGHLRTSNQTRIANGRIGHTDSKTTTHFATTRHVSHFNANFRCRQFERYFMSTQNCFIKVERISFLQNRTGSPLIGNGLNLKL